MDDPRDHGIPTPMRRLVSIAYRMLGSVADAEEVVQETYARWYSLSEAERGAIATPEAWTTTVITRICLDRLRLARSKREHYVGTWLPEPVPTDDAWWGTTSAEVAADPADRLTLDESIRMAFMVLLEALTPAERIAFILHDVYRYPFADIAAVTGRSPAACRQLASVARNKLRNRPDRRADSADTRVVRALRDAWERADINGLVALFDPDITVVADGGGAVDAAPKPVSGAEIVARRLVAVTEGEAGLQIFLREVNGEPGLVITRRGITVTVMSFEVVDNHITKVWSVRNPTKLALWNTRGTTVHNHTASPDHPGLPAS